MPKILVIDDEEQICEIVCDLMESEGYEVDSANDGESGLEKLKNDKFDLIFLDILMPGTDGLQILQQVQAIQAGYTKSSNDYYVRVYTSGHGEEGAGCRRYRCVQKAIQHQYYGKHSVCCA